MNHSEHIREIHQRAIEIVRKYKNAEYELIKVLQEAERRKIYFAFGYNSLFKYATDSLGLSEEVAYIFINVARKATQVPALKEEIKSGAITVSKAKRLTAVLSKQNQAHWLKLAKTVSKRELERSVAAVAPREAITDQMTFVHPNHGTGEKILIMSGGDGAAVRVQMQVGISEAVMLKLRKVQDLLGQRLRRPASLEDVFSVLADQYINKFDPLKRAERRKIRGKIRGDTGRSTGNENPRGKQGPGLVTVHRRGKVKASLRHQVYLRHGGRCSYIHNGGRCKETRFLEIHHIQPVANGGRDELSNLTLLCSGHHRMHHYPMVPDH